MNPSPIIENLHRAYTDFLAWKTAEFGSLPEREIGGEWECNYAAMPEVWAACFDFAQQIPAHQWQPEQAAQLLYLTARDNESEYIVEMLPEPALLRLCDTYRQQPVYDAGWQLADQLPRLSDRAAAWRWAEYFCNDPDEYTCRRALMVSGSLNAPHTERYAEWFWRRGTFRHTKGWDADEYQKIAVLQALAAMGSPLLPQYLRLARQDDRQYLVQQARELGG
ncbi:hypothetical protein H9Q10_09050 [Eikenella sp. S3360]|uniref:Uncharacterized protein n=1 Tax=Eikenella glucosivorans TaxID=2766967 RepID=A0ABS0NC32_9NEIS|nr:hypothetical protein [Eikenella glucosivorans]MBH5329814.1 hypothetical protein [Eikenella glucosivorans]